MYWHTNAFHDAIQSDTGNSKFRFWVFAKNVSNIDGLALQCVMFPLFTFEQHYNFKIFNLSLEKEIRWVVSARFDRRWSRAGLRCVLLPLAGAYTDVGERCVCANQNIWGRRKPINCDTWVRMKTQLRLVWRNAKRRKNFLSDWGRRRGDWKWIDTRNLRRQLDNSEGRTQNFGGNVRTQRLSWKSLSLFLFPQQNASQLKSKASAAESIWRIESKMTQIAFYCCISTLLSHFAVRMDGVAIIRCD